MIEMVDSELEIVNLYKTSAYGPYTKVNGGYGYRGVLVQHRKTGKVQCHVCGEWFKSMGGHSARKHKIDSVSYRRKFGFALSQPLCSASTSRKNSATTRRLKPWLTSGGKEGLRLWNKRNRRRHKYYPGSEAFLNSRAICDDQLLRRFLAVADVVGRDASMVDVLRHDKSLLGVVNHRYGTWNNFRKKHNLGVLRERHPNYNRDGILLAIREWVGKHKRMPKPRDFAGLSPGIRAVYKRFGSWNRALLAAGVTSDPNCGRKKRHQAWRRLHDA